MLPYIAYIGIGFDFLMLPHIAYIGMGFDFLVFPYIAYSGIGYIFLMLPYIAYIGMADVITTLRYPPHKMTLNSSQTYRHTKLKCAQCHEIFYERGIVERLFSMMQLKGRLERRYCETTCCMIFMAYKQENKNR